MIHLVGSLKTASAFAWSKSLRILALIASVLVSPCLASVLSFAQKNKGSQDVPDHKLGSEHPRDPPSSGRPKRSNKNQLGLQHVTPSPRPIAAFLRKHNMRMDRRSTPTHLKPTHSTWLNSTQKKRLLTGFNSTPPPKKNKTRKTKNACSPLVPSPSAWVPLGDTETRHASWPRGGRCCPR